MEYAPVDEYRVVGKVQTVKVFGKSLVRDTDKASMWTEPLKTVVFFWSDDASSWESHW